MRDYPIQKGKTVTMEDGRRVRILSINTKDLYIKVEGQTGAIFKLEIDYPFKEGEYI